jgi:hypothetical protein
MPVVFCRRLVLRLIPLLALISPGAALAQGADGFTVKNIVEEVRDENLAQGRNRALLLAQREAYQILLQRLTAQSDWQRLPKQDDASLEDLVQDVGIDQERVAPARIIATLSVHFKADAIRRLLRNAGIAYAEWRGRPLVILPLWQGEQGPVFADAANPWRDLWRTGQIQGLVPFSVPQQTDLLEGVAPSALAQPSDELLAALSQRLNNADLLVVLAAAGKTDNGQIRLDLTVSGLGPLAGHLSGQRGYGGEPGETLEQILQRAAAELARGVDDSWKSANLLQYDKQGSLLAMAPLGSFEDWLAIRDKLTRATAVRAYDLAALSKGEAALVLHYVGEQGQLESVLMQNGLVLTWEEEHWTLRNTGARTR